jgi:hypothetical protein
MLRIPSEFQSTISSFSRFFRQRTFDKAKQLFLGAIICPGSRTVCNVLRTIGLSQDKAFGKFHRVLNRAKYSMLDMSRHLLELLVRSFTEAEQYLVFGVDETIERRRGNRIHKKGVYRDPVRSSGSHFVKTTGLRWMVMMLLTPLPWLTQGAYWALPFLTALCPSKRFYRTKTRRRPKKLTDWARQFILFLARYAKGLHRRICLVGDGSYATYELMQTAQDHDIALVGRLKINARLFHLPKPKPPGKPGPAPHMGGRILAMEKRLTDGRIKWREVVFSEWYGQQNKRMLITQGVSIWDSNKGSWVKVKWVLVKDPDGKLDPILLASSDHTMSAVDIVRFAVRRWRVEVTFAEVRRHLGVETQRQWSELAIARTTPLLMAMKSLICVLALPLHEAKEIKGNAAAWYKKQAVTFSDVLSAVRLQIWPELVLSTSDEMTLVGRLRYRIRYLEQTLALAVA